MSKKEQKRKIQPGVIALVIVMVAIITLTVVTAMASSAYDVEIIDGETTKKISTKLDDPFDILKEQNINIDNEDQVDTTKFEPDNGGRIVVNRSANVIIINNGEEKIISACGTVKDALKKANIKVSENDYLNVDLTKKLYDNIVIEIRSGISVKVVCDGKTSDIVLPSGTSVKSAITRAGVTLSEDDTVNVPLTEKVDNNKKIVVSRVTFVENTRYEKVNYKTIKKETTSLAPGKTEVKVKGVNGEKKVVYKEKYVDNKYDSATVISETVTKNAVDEVVMVGKQIIKETTTKAQKTVQAVATTSAPKKTGNAAIKTISNFTLPSKYSVDSKKVPTKYSKKMTGSATAYYGGYSTSTGKKPQPGYIAVNPNIIPYGTEMWIVSNDGKFVYGYAIAADTGGFIYSGTTIADLYFNTYNECVNFGRRDITIYIL